MIKSVSLLTAFLLTLSVGAYAQEPTPIQPPDEKAVIAEEKAEPAKPAPPIQTLTIGGVTITKADFLSMNTDQVRNFIVLVNWYGRS
jgi:hypothetical protein